MGFVLIRSRVNACVAFHSMQSAAQGERVRRLFEVYRSCWDSTASTSLPGELALAAVTGAAATARVSSVCGDEYGVTLASPDGDCCSLLAVAAVTHWDLLCCPSSSIPAAASHAAFRAVADVSWMCA